MLSNLKIISYAWTLYIIKEYIEVIMKSGNWNITLITRYTYSYNIVEYSCYAKKNVMTHAMLGMKSIR